MVFLDNMLFDRVRGNMADVLDSLGKLIFKNRSINITSLGCEEVDQAIVDAFERLAGQGHAKLNLFHFLDSVNGGHDDSLDRKTLRELVLHIDSMKDDLYKKIEAMDE